MPEIRKTINLKVVHPFHADEQLKEVGELDVRDLGDDVFGPLRRKPGSSDDDWREELKWRMRGLKAMDLLGRAEDLEYVVKRWDKTRAGETEEDRNKFQYLESLVDMSAKTPEQFFKRMRRTLNRAIRIEDGGEYRTPRVEDTHPVFEVFDASVERLNSRLPEQSRISLEHRLPVESTSKHTIVFGRAWWYDPDAPVISKDHIPDYKVPEETGNLEQFRQRCLQRQEYLRTNSEREVSEQTEKEMERLSAEQERELTPDERRAVEREQEKNVTAERGHLDLVLEEGESGLIERAKRLVDDHKYNAGWALEAAKDELLADKRLEYEANPLMMSIMAGQLIEYEHAGDYAETTYTGKSREELAREAISNMPEGTIVFSPKALSQDEAVMFANAGKVHGVVVGGERDKAGPHFHRIFDERSGVSAYNPYIEEFPVETGDYAIVDTFTQKPQIIMDPTEKVRRDYLRWKQVAESVDAEKLREADQEARTRKVPERGVESETIQIAGNVSEPENALYLIKHGAKGSGLGRGEELLSRLDRIESYDGLEGYLFGEYSNMLDEFRNESQDNKKGYAVVLRAFDLGADKVPWCVKHFFAGPEKDPSIYRGARVLLDNPEFFKAQARAVLRLAYHYDEVDFMIPMVEEPGQIEGIRGLWQEAKDELARSGAQYRDDLGFGVMVEDKKLIGHDGDILKQVLDKGMKPISVGTNDLTRSILNLPSAKVYERINGVEEYHDHEPSVLSRLKLIHDLCSGMLGGADPETDKHYPLEVCGDMAGTNTGAILLVGMGYRKLSMVADRIPLVRRVIRDLPIDVMQRISQEILEGSFMDNQKVRAYVEEKTLEYADVDLKGDRYTK